MTILTIINCNDTIANRGLVYENLDNASRIQEIVGFLWNCGIVTTKVAEVDNAHKCRLEVCFRKQFLVRWSSRCLVHP